MADLLPLSEKNYLMIRESEKSMSENMIRQFFIETKDHQPVIKKAGLLFKMNEKYGKGNYSIKPEFPTNEELEMFKKFKIVGENMPCVLMKGVVTIMSTGAQFVDYYCGTQANTFNMRNVFEISATKAILRCLRAATECGFYSQEEMEDIPSPVSSMVEYSTQEQRNIYISLCKDLGFTKEKPGNLNQLITQAVGKELPSTKNCTRQEMDAILTVLNNELKKKGGVKEKETEQKDNVKDNIKDDIKNNIKKEKESEVIEGVVVSSEVIEEKK